MVRRVPAFPRVLFLVALAAFGILALTGRGVSSSPVAPPVGPNATDSRYYDMGNPGPFVELYVSPTGDDASSGTASTNPLRTLTAAWGKIPETTTPTTTGYRINLLSGTYPCEPEEQDNCINYFSDRAGSFQHPIVIRAASGAGTAILRGGLNIRNVRYLYLLDLNLVGGGTLPTNSSGNNLLHLESSDHVLLRGMSIAGPDCPNDSCNNLQEVLKVNQTQYLYVEDSTIGGAWHSSVDYMVVQYGHFLNNRVRTAGQWCMYVKGGTAYLKVEGNEFSGCQLGFQAGQSANLAVMRVPWLHYEVYDIKFVNNILHDIPGVGMSVSGAYNALLAHNTLYRVGTSTANGFALSQFVQGERGCTPTDDIPDPVASCSALVQQGAWGPDFQTDNVSAISNRNVFVFNNIFFNPPPSQTLYSHFAANGPQALPAGFRNAPAPAKTDDNLVIAGNLIWNGPADHPLGVGNAGEGCEASNPTCNPAQLAVSNTVNLMLPQLSDPEQDDFRPVAGGNVFTVTTYLAPSFTWSDAPAAPAVPAGNLVNTVNVDRAGNRRSMASPPGAYAAFVPSSAGAYATYLPVITRIHSGGW